MGRLPVPGSRFRFRFRLRLSRLPRFPAAVLAAGVATASVAGCVSIPNSGPVLSDPVTQGANAQDQPYPQLVPEPPAPGGSPVDIVRGFLAASASFADGQQVARDFLTKSASHAWQPTWSAATVFKGTGPQVGQVTYPYPGNRKLATVVVSGKAKTELSIHDSYAVPSASGGNSAPVTFTLARVGGQWRISRPPPRQRLLTSTEFDDDYQMRNLYFLDPTSRYLVPDPVYVPLQTTSTNLLNGLVRDLIDHPGGWLHDGTRTAFPPGTRLLGDVMVNGGTAEVNLGGAVARAGDRVREQISAQLLDTLSRSAQGQPSIQSVVLDVNGKPWSPPQAQQNPVQHSPKLRVPEGPGKTFYYLDSQGSLMSQSGASGRAVELRSLGSGYSAIAVSPDHRYLAALRGGTLYTGPLHGTLVKRAGNGYTTMSWDANDQLWATTPDGLVMLRGEVTGQSPLSLAGPESVTVEQPDGLPETKPITAVRVAPDGVRVAVIIGGTTRELAFGAIASRPPSQGQILPRPGQPEESAPMVTLSPFSVSGGQAGFSSLSWYGADNVVTLGAASGSAGSAGPALTEHSVDGASSTAIPTEPGIRSIATSAGSDLVAGTMDGKLMENPNMGGGWRSIGTGLAPAYPG
ncbi:MAG: GerMN domain-containing protein [Nocardiopsaceae bacterium]|nr:GerMN domain-containing protein [Nocardiopsaceae bacterium]